MYYIVVFSLFPGRDTEREQKLYSAAANGNVDVVKELLKSTFVDPTPPENLHFTPLMKAGKFLCNLLLSESLYHNFKKYFSFCSWTRTQRSS